MVGLRQQAYLCCLRPIACESELIIEIAPVSWRTSSAATVSPRIRDSAKAISSGIDRSRW